MVEEATGAGGRGPAVVSMRSNGTGLLVGEA